MKRIKTKTGKIFIGGAREIYSLYKNLEQRKIATPVFENPKMNINKFYGLVIDEYDELSEKLVKPCMMVISGDTALALLYDL